MRKYQMRQETLTHSAVKDMLHYDPESGIFTWRQRLSQRAKIGMQAGCVSTVSGYVLLGIQRKLFHAHRLAWFYVHGAWPKHQIDHINGNRSDNRLVNLRDVPNQVNSQNTRPKANRLVGASLHKKSGRWMARIVVKGKCVSLGYHASAQEAHAAYIAAKRRLHEGCTI
jgi:hypothetical protein